jgi:glycosyltransferase involved in cell wall biosynthesis
VAHLDPSRFEPLLAFGPGGLLDPEARDLERRGVARLRPVGDLVREISPWRDIRALLQIRAVLDEERPDVLHTHSSKAGVLGRLAGRLCRTRAVVHTFHGFGFHDRQGPLPRALCTGAERLCASAADRLIFVSRANRDLAASLGLGSPERYALIRSGIDLSRFPARIASAGEIKASLGFPPDAPMVVSVGNLKPQKNAPDFLRAASLVIDEVPGARFLFIGDGPMRASLEASARSPSLGGRVVFAGWRRDVPEILASADAFVLTSLWEGLPRSLVEAMRTGLPCACYATDGVSDIVEDGVNGFVVPRGDSRALAGRVRRLLQDPGLRQRLGRAAAASIGAEFDIDGMVRSQERLYEEILAQKPPPEIV